MSFMLPLPAAHAHPQRRLAAAAAAAPVCAALCRLDSHRRRLQDVLASAL